MSKTCPLACPECHAPVAASAAANGELTCPNGHGPWPLRDGVPWFIEEPALFDGRWSTTYRDCRSNGFWRPIAKRNCHWGIPHLFEPLLESAGQSPLQILDLGCGGGWEFLKNFGRVTGVDVSPAALQAASAVYDRTAGACVWRLPFPGNCFDVATSIWLVEHLREAEFCQFLREVRRVLRPSGHFIFLADLHSVKPILRWARSYPVEYQRYHVEKVGHYGLRSLSYTRHLIRREGFEELSTRAIYKSSLLQPVTARWMFDNALGRKSKLLRLYTLFARLTLKSAIAHRIVYNLLLEYHRWADQRLPDAYAFSAVFHCQAGHTGSVQMAHERETRKSRPESEEQDPWSGLPLGTTNSGRRPVAVMVDNVPAAFPQKGLAEATAIFQAPVEGLHTRLMAVYTRKLPAMAGPVRSARPYFIEWAGAFQPFFIHCGASPEAFIRLENPGSLIGLELRYRMHGQPPAPHAVLNAPVAFFDPYRNRPHFVFALSENIFKHTATLNLALPDALKGGGVYHLTHYRPQMKRTWYNWAHKHDVSHFVQVDIKTQPGAELGERFTWDSSASGFRRTATRENRPVAASVDPHLVVRNLMVLEARMEGIPGDLRGRMQIPSPGEGPGYLWRGGLKMEIIWRKFDPDMPLQCFDTQGKRVALRPGLTWIHFIGPGGEVSTE